jgi:hypothetical protein
MKWGTKFGPEYVNRLASMVRRHLSLPHRFVCFTDDQRDLDSRIDARPLPDFDDPGGPERGWRKISTFRSPLFDLTGPTLFVDLDVVIVGSMDCFFEYPGEFCIIKDWVRPRRPTGNSSVYRFEAGAHPWLLEKFMSQHADIRREVRNEQEYISRELFNAGKLAYWPKEWCVSFKYGCMAKFPMNWWTPARIPSGARIVVFHGHPNPPDAVVGRSKKLTRHVLPTPWVAEHWQ